MYGAEMDALPFPVNWGGSGDEGGGSMQSRVRKLEENITEIQIDIAVIKSNYATKEDLGKLREELKGDNYALREELKEDNRALREELKGEIGVLREELKGEIGVLREEVKGEIGVLREEVKEEISALRKEVKGDIGALREELKKDISVLRDDFQKGIGVLDEQVKAYSSLFSKEINELKVSVSDTRALISETKSSIILWVVSAVIFAQLIPAIPAILKVFFPS